MQQQAGASTPCCSALCCACCCRYPKGTVKKVKVYNFMVRVVGFCMVSRCLELSCVDCSSVLYSPAPPPPAPCRVAPALGASSGQQHTYVIWWWFSLHCQQLQCTVSNAPQQSSPLLVCALLLQTYGTPAVEIIPGPRLNLVLGPNGEHIGTCTHTAHNPARILVGQTIAAIAGNRSSGVCVGWGGGGKGTGGQGGKRRKGGRTL
mgnify:CR=1 FL=1